MEENNSPYQAPQSQVAMEQQPGGQPVPANRWLRLANFVIDYIGFFALALLIGIVAGMIGGEQVLDSLEGIPDFLIGMVIMLFYYVPLEAAMGRTLGKFVTGTKVVNLNGEKPRFSQILGRTFCRFIPFEAFSFLFGEGRGWHDSVPDTFVVKCR